MSANSMKLCQKCGHPESDHHDPPLKTDTGDLIPCWGGQPMDHGSCGCMKYVPPSDRQSPEGEPCPHEGTEGEK